MQFPPNNDGAARFRDAEANRRRVNDLLFAAFPARSQHAVSQRAALALGRDARTIRSWMDGRTVPNWNEIAVIAAYAGFERAAGIIFGGRD